MSHNLTLLRSPLRSGQVTDGNYVLHTGPGRAPFPGIVNCYIRQREPGGIGVFTLDSIGVTLTYSGV